ncbi:serine/arginine repetitive matrix protein 2 [Osmerus mordax]|uniref:serine/arginine repetitive matrix protein 2 n=1 Tax=Osmerus mordax TaxID=8014 RepID=UPI00350F927D
MSQISNITVRSPNAQPDDGADALHRELRSEAERIRSFEPESLTPDQENATADTPLTGRVGATRGLLVGVSGTGLLSAGYSVERGHRERDLWSSGNQTGTDGSLLGFLPQPVSQSTPGVFHAPVRTGSKPKLGLLSAIGSNPDVSHLSGSRRPSQPAAVSMPDIDAIDLVGPQPGYEASGKVHSLPSLNYLQKVDAWRTNQSSMKTSLFDSLALQGFSGVSPKQRAYDAVSGPLNRMLTQQGAGQHQAIPGPSSDQNPTTPLSGPFSPTRGEAVGCAPLREDGGVAGGPPGSALGRSQSHSSLSTVVTTIQHAEQPRREEGSSQALGQAGTATPREPEGGERGAGPGQAPGAGRGAELQQASTAQPSGVADLGWFSDVSTPRDGSAVFSSSQDSGHSGRNLGASAGASSAVSLEVDNYAPYWNSKPSTPARERELNIEDRIPLYLRNLGIDQSPSTILTPFAPRGPIREPEFSPTDLCTVKGSVGTPTKSSQPSEGDSPHKEEFSRASLLSMDSSLSIPLSVDSLHPMAPYRDPNTSSPLDRDPSQGSVRLALSTVSPQPQDTHQPPQPSRPGVPSHAATELGERYEGLAPGGQRTGAPEPEVSMEQSREDSFVGSKTLQEIRRLLGRAENIVSGGSSSSSSPGGSQPHLDEDSLFSARNRMESFQRSSLTCSSAGDLRTYSTSLVWGRSSSDSMLLVERLRENSTGTETGRPPREPAHQPGQTLSPREACVRGGQPRDGSAGTGSDLPLPKAVRRAEPEGCSAGPSDAAARGQLPVPPINTLPGQHAAATAVQPRPALRETPGGGEEEGDAEGVEEEISPFSSPSSSSSSAVGSGQGAGSEGSSSSSLAARVARLLQRESPATMVSSRASSNTDLEESRAREWIKLKLSGLQCEPLELDAEDRLRIEEIKRELLLSTTHTFKSQGSTDTESSAASSLPLPLPPSQPAERFSALRAAEERLSHQLQTLTMASLDPNQPPAPLPLNPSLHPPQPQNLEGRVREIAHREGVSLPRAHLPPPLTSITITTCRRSPSPLPPSSPEPLQLAQLSREGVPPPAPQPDRPPTTHQGGTAAEPASAPQPNGHHARTMNHVEVQAGPEEAGLGRDTTGRSQGSATINPPGQAPGHVSLLHLTLSPKPTEHTQAPALSSRHSSALTGPLHDGHTPQSTLTNQERAGTTREPMRRRDVSVQFATTVPEWKTSSRYPQSFTPPQRLAPPSRPIRTPAVPVLLPYKPLGSENMFYVPQTEAQLSPIRSDTTVESSHTGSDDAVPPQFSADVLGSRDQEGEEQGVDRGVNIRHTEGIYSKRLRGAGVSMQGGLIQAGVSLQPGHAGAESPLESSSYGNERQAPPSFPQGGEAPSSGSAGAVRDQRTTFDLPEGRGWRSPSLGEEGEEFQPLPGELDYSMDRSCPGPAHTPLPQEAWGPERRGFPKPAPQQTGRSLDQLWRRFSQRWSLEESRPTSEREASLLERLERLSRLIHSGTPSTLTYPDPAALGEDAVGPGDAGRRAEEGEGRRTREERTREERTREERTREERTEGSGRGGVRQAWLQEAQTQEAEPLAAKEEDEESRAGCGPSPSRHLWPAERERADSVSESSSSRSTVDTARLVRAFGAGRVRGLKTGTKLRKLHSTIHQQRQSLGQRQGRTPPLLLSETTATDESIMTADSASSASTYTTRRGPSLSATRGVKRVSRGVQAGDMEVISKGTRSHTRDVGTTFPSPAPSQRGPPSLASSSSGERGRAGGRSPPKTQTFLRDKKTSTLRGQPKHYPRGVSWFLPAEDLKAEARKENQPEGHPAPTPGPLWVEASNRPWREPLRPRQAEQSRTTTREGTRGSRPGGTEPPPQPSSKPPSALVRISLQEALELRRPEFMSRSRERIRRLALQVEERRLQAIFSRERDELFNRPGAAGRLHRPHAGPSLLRRAVPKKEMVQRSKQIYSQLAEVQKRREEDRRKAEYRSYRLNAQLYNKKITNRVLGRRTPWQ